MEGDNDFTHRHILGLKELSASDIGRILDTANSLKEVSSRAIKKVPVLQGRTLINLFFEPSTRTRLSFEVAAKRMSGDTFNISSTGSSATKGETLLDTVRNIEAMKADIIIVRHSHSGAAHFLSHHLNCSVINAGDGINEHPSQGLLDIFTIQEHKHKITGLKVAIIGDILHSRVAHSNIIGLCKMGAKVHLYGPATLLPPSLEQLGATLCQSMPEALEDADVVMTLRIQRERQQEPFFPSLREYRHLFGLNSQKIKPAKPDALIMHPGPVNRNVEISPALADSDRSVILDQVTNGVAVRMALLYLINSPAKTA